MRAVVPMRVTRRGRAISSFEVMDVLERADALERAGREIIHLEVGEPDFVTADPIRSAGRAAIEAGRTRYTPACGLPELREAIAGYYAERYGIDLPGARIVVTPGASGALGILMALLLEGGDEVLLADPGYPCYANFVRLAGAQPRTVPVDLTRGTEPRAFAEAWGARTRMLLVGSPCNPTGEVLSRERLDGLAHIARARGGCLVSDEIYHGLTYLDEDAPTALAVDRDAIVVNSFSKYFGMTGWRVGWLVVPEALVDPVNRIAQNTVICASSIAQHAALAAFSPSAMAIHEQRRAAFRARRDFLVPGLEALGFTVPLYPGGAFYVYAGIAALGFHDARRFTTELLEATGVALTPGTDFGTHDAQHWVRFALTAGVPRLELALERIARFLRG